MDIYPIIPHDSLPGFVANKHIDHTAVTMTAGTGLTGGGTIASDRTFNVAANLAAINALAVTDGNFIVGNGSTWVAESGNTARTSLGLGTGDTPTFVNVHISSGEEYDTILEAENGELEADRTLTIELSNADRHITLDGNPLLNNWFDQSVKAAASPTFNNPILTALTFNLTQDYLFTERGSSLVIQSQTADTYFGLELFSEVGDGDDSVQLVFWGIGTPASVDPSEYMIMRYNATGPDFEIFSGTDNGIVRPLSIYTGANTTQLVLNIDNSIDMSGALGVTGTVSGATGSTFGNLTLADGSITDSGGTISFGDDHISTSGNLTVEDIYHTGDVDTTIGFGVDNITFNAGGLNFVYMKELFIGQDELVFNDGGVDIDTRIEGVGQTHALFVQGSDGRVGIGTPAPNAPLEVKGAKPGVVGGWQSGQLQVTGSVTDEFYNAVITGHNAFDGNTQLWYLGSMSSSNNNIAFINRQNAAMCFYTNNADRMIIDAAGNVGINETAPQDKLEVNGTGLFKDKLKFTQDDGNENIDSLNDGYMDYGATTGHRFNNDVLIANTKVLKINSIQVVGAQQAHIADSSTVDLTGTDSIDQTQLESDLTNIVAAVNAALSALETHGLLASA